MKKQVIICMMKVVTKVNLRLKTSQTVFSPFSFCRCALPMAKHVLRHRRPPPMKHGSQVPVSAPGHRCMVDVTVTQDRKLSLTPAGSGPTGSKQPQHKDSAGGYKHYISMNIKDGTVPFTNLRQLPAALPR